MRFSTRKQVRAAVVNLIESCRDIGERLVNPYMWMPRRTRWKRFKELINADAPNLAPPKVPTAEEQMRLPEPGAWGAHQYPFLEPLVDRALAERWEKKRDALQRLAQLGLQALGFADPNQADLYLQIMTLPEAGVLKKMQEWTREIRGFKGFRELSERIEVSYRNVRAADAAWEKLHSLATDFGFLDKALYSAANEYGGIME